MIHEWSRGEYTISTDRARLDLNLVHQFLAGSYWAEGIPASVVRRSIEHSLVFGLYRGAQQLGFARVITDYATFAYLADVFVVEGARGAGLGTWLIEVIIKHPELQGLRRWMLATRDAHGLYRKVGFSELSRPERFMERHFPDIYTRGGAAEIKEG
ncbi:MAG: N-acetyltransferase [Herpetosiphonaceae bacterium]|nr:MAG: N-acetyltransferase [Herpetosiphonaceae bacterium]